MDILFKYQYSILRKYHIQCIKNIRVYLDVGTLQVKFGFRLILIVSLP